MKRIGTVLLLAACLFMAWSGGALAEEKTVSPGPGARVPSDWQTDFNAMHLVQEGALVLGVYELDEGRIAGKLEGGVLRGWWTQANYRQECGPENRWSGPVVLQFARDGKSFQGRYGYCFKGHRSHEALPARNRWDGTLTSGAINLGAADVAVSSPPEHELSRLVSEWQTDFDVMRLVREGDTVFGAYDLDDGRLVGTLEAGVFRGWWTQANHRQECGPNNRWTGPVVLQFAPDGKSFQGRYGYCYKGHSFDDLPIRNRWNGVLTKGSIND